MVPDDYYLLISNCKPIVVAGMLLLR